MRLKSTLLLLGLALSSMAKANSTSIWATIPFIRGADLCQYNQMYSTTRIKYMNEMKDMAMDLMMMGAKGPEALAMLKSFDRMYDKNLNLAMKYKRMEVTLENTLKQYLSGYYDRYPVRGNRIRFRHMNSIHSVVGNVSRDRRQGHMPENTYGYVDYVAYGSYQLAPNCQGNIQVTLTLVGSDGYTENFGATARPNVVMSHIASRIFERFHQTKFPTTLRIGNNTLTLLGGLNGSVDTARTPRNAQEACEEIDARLPSSRELERISSYGDWNGGVGIGQAVWAIRNGTRPLVYHPGLMNPSPVRRLSEVNTRTFKYYCVR